MTQHDPAPITPMVFTLEEDTPPAHNTLDEPRTQEWETAPHDWSDPDAPDAAVVDDSATNTQPDPMPPHEAEPTAEEDKHNDTDPIHSSVLQEALQAFKQPEPQSEDPPTQTTETPHDDAPVFHLDQPTEDPTPPPDPEAYAAAQRHYLHHLEKTHNQNVQEHPLDATDPTTPHNTGVIIEEDWLAAQTQLNQAQGQDYQLPLNTQHLSTPQQDITVHVYDIVDWPVGQKVHVISEAAFMDHIRAQLRPHLSNAVAGLAARLLQKKTAMISYELQMMLHEAVPEVVEEILDHHLQQSVQNAKHTNNEPHPPQQAS